MPGNRNSSSLKKDIEQDRKSDVMLVDLSTSIVDDLDSPTLLKPGKKITPTKKVDTNPDTET
jgi:hypothetical protein